MGTPNNALAKSFENEQIMVSKQNSRRILQLEDNEDSRQTHQEISPRKLIENDPMVEGLDDDDAESLLDSDSNSKNFLTKCAPEN